MPYLDCGRCYCQEVDGYPLLFFLADVNANGMWQMFLPLQCIATIDWLMLLPSGRWTNISIVIGWSVMRNTLVNPLDLLVRGSKTSQGTLPIYDHYNTTGHNVPIENFSILGREDQNLCRWIKEALYIRVNNPSLNKNIGKYHLPHIWDEVLHNTSELKLK